MNAPLPTSLNFDVQGLVHAVSHNQSLDAFHPSLTAKQWELLGSYLQPFAVRQGQVVIEQNANDRTVYLIETGQLTVHYEDDKGRLRLAVVDAGWRLASSVKRIGLSDHSLAALVACTVALRGCRVKKAPSPTAEPASTTARRSRPLSSS